MSLIVKSTHLTFSAPEIEERGYLSPDELDYIPSDLNIKIVRTLQSHSLQTTLLPQGLSSLRFIHAVDLSGTQIRGEDLEHLPPRIRELNVEDCEEIEMLPASLRELEFLSILNASKTYIRNESLNNLPDSLEVLKIESCKRISEIPKKFIQMKNLISIHLADTKVYSLDNLPHSIEKIDARQCPVEFLGGSFQNRSRLHEIYLSYKYFDVDSLRSIAANIWPEYIQLKTISIDRESAITFYKRFNMRSFQKSGFNEDLCVELIKKHAPKLKNVSIVIE